MQIAMGKKREKRAWNQFADIARAGLVGAALALPKRGRGPGRLSAAVCFLGIKSIVEALKIAVPERRPDGDNKKSFPSEHAAECTAAAMIIDSEYPGAIGTLAYALAGAVSIARIEGRKHYPRDVLAGALIGCSAARLSLKLNRAPARSLDRSRLPKPSPAANNAGGGDLAALPKTT
jgi:membrane-associated phospholipid phosphatase